MAIPTAVGRLTQMQVWVQGASVATGLVLAAWLNRQLKVLGEPWARWSQEIAGALLIVAGGLVMQATRWRLAGMAIGSSGAAGVTFGLLEKAGVDLPRLRAPVNGVNGNGVPAPGDDGFDIRYPDAPIGPLPPEHFPTPYPPDAPARPMGLGGVRAPRPWLQPDRALIAQVPRVDYPWDILRRQVWN